MNRRTLFKSLAAVGLAAALPWAHAATPLHLEVYNPGDKAIFPVSSVLVSSDHEIVLIDAQFQRNDAQTLVDKIKASGKTLTTVYISHSDPDYYFGLDVIQAAFPAAKIVATPQTVAAIQASMAGKQAYWSPILKDNAPQKLVLPEVLKADHLTLAGQRIEIKGLKGPNSARSYLWIPALKTVAGGVVVFSGTHVWVADTQTPESRQQWQQTLKSIVALKPTTVVPGHYLGQAPQGAEAARFTGAYLTAFETEAAQAKDSAALVGAMKQRYPQLGEPASLELSAKVIKGEMKWPQ